MAQKKTMPKKEFTLAGEETRQPVQSTSKRMPVDVPVSFDNWWLKIQGKYNLRPELKTSIRKHFESRGFMDYKKFDQGLRDFGFRT